jgi:integrase
MRLNKTTVDNLSHPESGQVFYWDEQLPGFGLYIGKSAKTWCVQQRIGNKTRRIVLGRYPALTPEQARISAKQMLGKLASGIDVNVEKREQRIKSITLGEVFDDFLSGRQLKPKTVKDYTAVMSRVYGDWQKLPITEISRDDVEERHNKVGAENGLAYANLAARTLRSVLNYASAKYEVRGASILPENPVKRLSQTRSWYRIERRTGHLQRHQLNTWFSSVLALENSTIRDYLQFVLLTGCRKEEAMRLRWADIDLIDRSFIIRNPKNHRPIRLPLSDYLIQMLSALDRGEFVFPGDGVTGHLTEPKRQIAKIIEQTGIQFTLHDLRRSYITIAESLDISSYAVKALVNHRMGDDVTGGYIQLNVERLRQPMQIITDLILVAAGLRSDADVVAIRA